MSAVKKAAYKYGGLFNVLIEQSEKDIVVTLQPTGANRDAEAAIGRFQSEVLDQDLREEVAAETSGIRDLILAHTFSKTSLIDAELETSEYDGGSPDAGTGS